MEEYIDFLKKDMKEKNITLYEAYYNFAAGAMHCEDFDNELNTITLAYEELNKRMDR